MPDLEVFCPALEWWEGAEPFGRWGGGAERSGVLTTVQARIVKVDGGVPKSVGGTVPGG